MKKSELKQIIKEVLKEEENSFFSDMDSANGSHQELIKNNSPINYKITSSPRGTLTYSPNHVKLTIEVSRVNEIKTPDAYGKGFCDYMIEKIDEIIKDIADYNSTTIKKT